VADCGFEKKFRLLSASDFSELKVGSLSFKKPSVIIYFKKNSLNLSRIGLSVPKKMGRANKRNRLKRIIRETFRQSPYKFLGYDILFVVSWSRSIIDKTLIEKETLLIKNINDFFLHASKLEVQERS